MAGDLNKFKKELIRNHTIVNTSYVKKKSGGNENGAKMEVNLSGAAVRPPPFWR